MNFSKYVLNFFSVGAAAPPPPPPAEEPEPDLVDPLDTLREECMKDGVVKSLKYRLENCNDRVNSRTKTEETCMEELFDFVHEMDHCIVHHKLFSYLK